VSRREIIACYLPSPARHVRAIAPRRPFLAWRRFGRLCLGEGSRSPETRNASRGGPTPDLLKAPSAWQMDSPIAFSIAVWSCWCSAAKTPFLDLRFVQHQARSEGLRDVACAEAQRSAPLTGFWLCCSWPPSRYNRRISLERFRDHEPLQVSVACETIDDAVIFEDHVDLPFVP